MALPLITVKTSTDQLKIIKIKEDRTMIRLTDQQYQAIKTVAEELLSRNGHVDVEELLVELDTRVASGDLPPIFTATLEEAYERYRLETITVFIRRWEVERKEYWLGVATRAEHTKSYYRLEDAGKEPLVAMKARQEYLTALTMLKTYAPYAASWGKTLQDVCWDLDEVKMHIMTHWKELVGVKEEMKVS